MSNEPYESFKRYGEFDLSNLKKIEPVKITETIDKVFRDEQEDTPAPSEQYIDEEAHEKNARIRSD